MNTLRVGMKSKRKIRRLASVTDAEEAAVLMAIARPGVQAAGVKLAVGGIETTGITPVGKSGMGS